MLNVIELLSLLSRISLLILEMDSAPNASQKSYIFTMSTAGHFFTLIWCLKVK